MRTAHNTSILSFVHAGLAASALLASLNVHASTTFPLTFNAKVIHVDDGDTLVLLDENKKRHSIRLTDLDAPETPKEKQNRAGQPFSSVSGQHLSKMAKGKMANAHCYEYDPYNRLVCRITVDGRDMSLEQIRAGYAWANGANPKYVRDSRAYAYQDEAQKERRGLWRDPAPVAPWVWRKTCWQQQQCAGAGF